MSIRATCENWKNATGNNMHYCYKCEKRHKCWEELAKEIRDKWEQQ